MIKTLFFDLDFEVNKEFEVFSFDKDGDLIFVDSLKKLTHWQEKGALCVGVAPLEQQQAYRDLNAAIVIASLDEFLPFESTEQFNKTFRKLTAKEKALKTRENAFAPYSKFKVGSALVSKQTKQIYSAVNVENVSYGATICAERGAILAAVANEGIFEIESLVVVSEILAVPCALCLQVMVEFATSESCITLYDLKGNSKEYSFSELLPHPFNDFPQ
jgi:cytidine deaminase